MRIYSWLIFFCVLVLVVVSRRRRRRRGRRRRTRRRTVKPKIQPYVQPKVITPPIYTPTTPQNTCESTRNHYWNSATQVCHQCPLTKNNKKFSIFWETYADGCEAFLASDASNYVTHIYWSFSKIDPRTGNLELHLQGNDQTLFNCAKFMRRKCIKNMVSIGGAANRKAFLQLNNAKRLANFKKSAIQLMQKYNLDGIDIDDESSNKLTGGWLAYSQTTVIGYIKTLKAAFQEIPLKPGEPPHALSWTEFPFSVEGNRYCNKKRADWRRCYNDKITGLVDWVNVMGYNFGSLSTYDKVVEYEIPKVWAKRVPASKIVLGTCRGKVGQLGSCSYGVTPLARQVQDYARLGANYGGVFLWTGSADWSYTKGTVMRIMGKEGNYGHN